MENFNFCAVTFFLSGSVWNGVLKYQIILSEPLAEAEPNNNITFTPLYLDFFEDGQIGLGMLITMAIGVFSKEKKRRLLGVAGIDIRMTQLEQQYPSDKLGAFGHGFAINNNGLFLIHPKYRDPSPIVYDLPTVYLDELEYTSDITKAIELKQGMLERKVGCLTTETHFLFPEKFATRFATSNTTFCYHPLQNTPFTSGIAIPKFNKYIIDVDHSKIELFKGKGINGLKGNDHEVIEVASSEFCDIPAIEQKNKPASKKYFPTAKELYDYLYNDYQSINEKCEIHKLYNLIFTSAVISNHTNTFWNSFPIYDVHKRYIITRAGYIIFSSNTTESINRNIFTDELFLHPYSFQKVEEPFFTVSVRTKHTKGRIKLGLNYEEKDQKLNETLISISKLFGAEHVSHGVIGIVTSSRFLNSILVNSSHGFKCSNSSNCEKLNCSDNESYQCYLIDENAYIVSSNQRSSDIGVFFGMVNGALLEELTNKSVYSVKEFNDTQSICTNTIIPASSDASYLTSFYLNFIKSIVYLLHELFYLMFYFIPNITQGSIEDEITYKTIICTKTLTIYKKTEQNVDINHYVHCTDSCTEDYHAKSIETTNLLLLVVQNRCNFSCHNYAINNEPVRVEQPALCDSKIHARKKLPICNRRTSTKRSKAVCLENYFNFEFIFFYFVIHIF